MDTLGPLLYDLGYMRATLESLWSNLEKHRFPQIDFNDFMHLQCHFGITLRLLWAYESDFDVMLVHSGATLGSLWDTLGSLRDTLGSLGATLEYFWVILGLKWSHSGTLWRHLGALWDTWGPFWATLGLLWGWIWITFGQFGLTFA